MNGIIYINTNLFQDHVLFQKGITMISSKRKEKINKLINPAPARLSLGAGVLLRIALERNNLAERIEDIKIEKHGKPYLEGEDFYFNISHSGDYAICAYSDNPLGVDIQKIKNTFPKHTKKILSTEEKIFLNRYNEMDIIPAFYRLWARKESLIKWDGRGLQLPLHEISLAEDGTLIDNFIYEGKKIYFKEYDFLHPEYAICICSEKNKFNAKAEEITEKILTNY